MRQKFNPAILTPEDRQIAYGYVNGMKEIPGVGYFEKIECPDLVLAPDGTPYIYRWYVVPRNKTGNVYFHVQVASDPLRPLHDPPWDNTSVVLSGGYNEHHRPLDWNGEPGPTKMRRLFKGSVIHRVAEEPHRIELPPGVPYTMSLFTTGPKRRDWGFHTDHGWKLWSDCTLETPDGRSTWKDPT